MRLMQTKFMIFVILSTFLVGTFYSSSTSFIFATQVGITTGGNSIIRTSEDRVLGSGGLLKGGGAGGAGGTNQTSIP